MLIDVARKVLGTSRALQMIAIIFILPTLILL